jgi:co-chaperonin GroES (HSP10)
MYPWVFVRVLPREQVRKSGIILPDIDQNKTVLEGIVLSTWAEHELPNGTKVRSECALGDHVLFPHWTGLPIIGFKDKHYRIVREVNWAADQGGIFAKVEYGQKQMLETELKAVLKSSEGETYEGLIEKLMERFIFIDVKQQSVTLSGR